MAHGWRMYHVLSQVCMHGVLAVSNPPKELRDALLCSSICRITTLMTQELPHVHAELEDADVSMMPQARPSEGRCHNPWCLMVPLAKPA